MTLSHPARAVALAMVMGSSVALAACGGSEPEPAAAPTEAVIELPTMAPLATIEVVMPSTEITSTTGITSTTEMTSTTDTTSTTSTTTTTTITDTGVYTP